VNHHWDERIGDGPFRGQWVMAYDDETRSHPVHLFADSGDIVVYRGTLQGNVWTFSGEQQLAAAPRTSMEYEGDTV